MRRCWRGGRSRGRGRKALTDLQTLDPETGEKLRKIRILGREFVMPRSRFVRIVIGLLLVCGGLLGFLPVLGFWMIPLGVVVLSYEFAMVRRWRRRSEVWLAQKHGRRRRPQGPGRGPGGDECARRSRPRWDAD